MRCPFYIFKFFLLLFYPFLFSATSFAQLVVTPSQPATVLANRLAGPGVTISNPVLTCAAAGNGTFTVTPGTIMGAGPATFAIDSGIILSTGLATGAAGLESTLASTNNGTAGDASLAAIVTPATTYDACVLEFDFIPTGDTVSFNYQFGSEEYNHSTCGQYNDPFAFFISGPGIAGTQNMALVPGTTIPVAVNSVNSGVPGPTGLCPTCNISNCTAMGPGSPFTAYFVDNTGGTHFTYKGFTTKFTAFHSVIPCNQYHMKLAICDVSNRIYDSGVFIEAGSLKTNIYTFNHADSIGATINGTPNTIVKGCSPTTVYVTAGHANATAQTIHFLFGGTAINGTDVTAIADSIVLPADSVSVPLTIQGLPTAVSGTKTFIIYIKSACAISDSVVVNILDTPSAYILTPDTSVCPGQSFQIRVAGTPGLVYSWAPPTGLSSASVMQPVVTVFANTTYTMTATLPNSGCPNINRHISVSTSALSFSLLTPDTSVCIGQSVHIRASGSDTAHYLWTPGASLDSINVIDPIATPTVTTTYTVTATSQTGCNSVQQVTITIVNITASISNPDTAICRGGKVPIRAVGDPTLTYQWLPTAGISQSTVLDPTIIPDTSATYYLFISVPGCSSFLDSIKIDVQPNPTVLISGRRVLCHFDTVHLHALISPNWYTHYKYTWTPGKFLDDSTYSTVVFTAGDSVKLYLNVTTPAGCISADSADIVVHNMVQDTLTNANLCPGDSVQLIPLPGGGAAYHWSPGIYLSDSTSATPWVHAITSQAYRMIATNEYGCNDTAYVNVTIQSNAVAYLGDSVILYPGESYQIQPQTNCTYFTWTPAAGLNSPYLSNPIATPQLSTKYIVHAYTEWGCSTVDSINIYVNQETLLDLPNAFTPGTGPNSIFKIIKRGIATLQYFRIYNRWGNLVYQSSDIDAGWDGTYKGTAQPFDVYVYDVEATTSTGHVFHKHGNVTLVR